MDELYSVRQLQDILRVDRVTIYRMLERGQLPGFKLGGQWRFRRDEIQAWLEGQRPLRDRDELPRLSTSPADVSALLPLSCMDPIQQIIAEAMSVTACTVEENGVLLTSAHNLCRFCQMILTSERGQGLCQDSRAKLAIRKPTHRPKRCHAGVLMMAQPIQVEGRRIALAVAEGFVVSPDGLEEIERRLPRLVAATGIAEARLRAAIPSIHHLSGPGASKLWGLLGKAAATFAEMTQQRMHLMGRLQTIANIAGQASPTGVSETWSRE